MRERKGIRQRVAELRIIPWVLLSLPPFLECLDIELVNLFWEKVGQGVQPHPIFYLGKEFRKRTNEHRLPRLSRDRLVSL